MSETADDKRRAELLEQIQEAQTEGISQALIAKQIGMSASVVSQWIKGNYKGDNHVVETKLEGWLQARRDQELMTIPDAPEWIETPTGGQIVTTLTYAHNMGDVAVIYGGAGVGKTSALKHYQSVRPNVWLVTISPATTSVTASLEEIADALGVRTMPMGSARIKREVIRRINGTRGLLVIDESQHLTVPALECVRAIHDETGIGLVLVGNETVYSRLAGGHRAATFAQLFSRIGKRLHLNGPEPDDVEALASGWKVTDDKERRLLARIASSPGALRGVVKTLRLASVLALGDQQEISYRYIEAAWRNLGGFDHTGGARKRGR